MLGFPCAHDSLGPGPPGILHVLSPYCYATAWGEKENSGRSILQWYDDIREVLGRTWMTAAENGGSGNIWRRHMSPREKERERADISQISRNFIQT